MNLRSLTLLFIVLLTAYNTILTAQRRGCSTMDYLQLQQSSDPARPARLNQIEFFTNQVINDELTVDGVITVPVVVHVVYNTAEENISTDQILSQIQVLNEDFRRLNADADDTWPQAADIEIEFCLANTDPAGNPTGGITRTPTSASSFSTNDQVKYDSRGGKNAWPAGEYMNIWVCDIGGSILGYAQFPGGPASTDGIVVDYRYFGTTGVASAPFDLGRTCTHEVGHWLNLRHIWGDGNCSTDDFVSDTPLAGGPNYTGHPCRFPGPNTCNTGANDQPDMFQNYMDYSFDGCMNLFTFGQRARMRALFEPGGPRASILSSSACSGTPPAPTCEDGQQNGDETGIDCGGSCPDQCTPDCTDTEITLTLVLDNYPEETSWQLTASNGDVAASDGPYRNLSDGSTVVEQFCLPDDCYNFTIYDSYGDGICCRYGYGEYTLTDDNGNVLASGDVFGRSESTNFCLGDQTDPTCEDGIRNGDETGVDCGGSCPTACPTCEDGIQNGDETGIDCGGSCPTACPTCEDGIQNGDETGIDCGGSCPTACPTCEDGIQNGDETGIDCGGSCPTACPTCEDGIRNGDETGIDCGGSCPTACDEEGTCNDILLDYNNFESGWGIWNDGGSDCRRSSADARYALGTYAIRLRDNSRTSVMTTDPIDLASYGQLKIAFSYYPLSMDNSSEGFWLQVATGGNDFVTVEEWNRTDEFNNNQRYYDTVEVAGPFSSETRLRFRCDASSNSDWVYIDEISISACGQVLGLHSVNNQNPPAEPLIRRRVPNLQRTDGAPEMSLYPNPAANELTVSFVLENAGPVDLSLLDIYGRTLNRTRIHGIAGRQQTQINVSGLQSGFYFIQLNIDEKQVVDRFVVTR